MEIATRRFFIKRSVNLNEYPLQDLQLFDEEGKNSQPKPFAYTNVASDNLDSKF